MNNTRMFSGRKIDSTLGIYHALENRKNLVLMVASFAFSILMFMSFFRIDRLYEPRDTAPAPVVAGYFPDKR